MGKGDQLEQALTRLCGERLKAGIVSLFVTLIFSMSTSRTAFHGRNRKLVLAFDVGTTYSGISYRYANLRTKDDGRCSLILDNSVLDPGVIPEIKGVTKSVEMTLKTLINLFNPTVW